MHHHSGPPGPPGAHARASRGRRLLLVALVFGAGFLFGAGAMWARPQATRPGTAVRGAVRHGDGAAAGHHTGGGHGGGPHGFVKPVGTDPHDHEGLAVPAGHGHGGHGGGGGGATHHDGGDADHHHADGAHHPPPHQQQQHMGHAADGHGARREEDAAEHDDGNHVEHEAGHHTNHDDHADHHDHDGGAASEAASTPSAAELAAEEAQRAKLLALVPADSIEAVAIKRAVGGTLFVIPVNDGYIDFGLNLLCSMERLRLFRGLAADGTRVGAGYIFVAMDELAYGKLQRMGLPVVKDPDVPFVSSKSAAWGDPKFHQLVCTKLIPVLRFLRAGLNVVLSDADIVFRHDPFPFVRRDLGMTFTIGSCHKDLPDNFNLASEDGLAKLNTGFYHAVSSPGVISLLARALENCKSSHLTGDQPAINSVLHDDQNKGLPGYTYGFFDGCLFANGCIFFKHLCANTSMPDPRPQIASGHGSATAKAKVHSTKLGAAGVVPAGHIRRDDPVLVHANFLVGKKDKIKHLRRYDLWADACIATWRGNVTEPPPTPTPPAGGSHGDAPSSDKKKKSSKKADHEAAHHEAHAEKHHETPADE